MFFLYSVFDKSDFLKYHEHWPGHSWTPSIRALTPSYKDSASRLCKPKLDDSAEGGGITFISRAGDTPAAGNKVWNAGGDLM